MQFARHLISRKKEFRKLNNPNGNMTIKHLDVAVVQQYGAIKDSPVRGAMIGNSKMFMITSRSAGKTRGRLV
jgi:hypothetical protein